MSISAARETRRDNLFDLVVASPDGVTVSQMMAEMDLTKKQAGVAIRDLRLFLGEYDGVNLPCVPQKPGEEWVYHLAGTLDDVREWAISRINDTVSRLLTMDAVMSSIVEATDGRSLEGRKARIIERSLARLLEDIETMQTADNPPLFT